MAELNKVRVQVLDPKTGAVVESVDVKTSVGAVYLPDGTTLKDYINNSDLVFSEFQKKLAEHCATKHVDADKVDSVLTGVEYNKDNGVFTITKHDGTTEEVDTLLEKLAVNFDLVDVTDEVSGKVTKQLEITLDDGTKKYADLSDLIDVYEGSNGDEVVITVVDGKIAATLVDGSIAYEKLDDALKAKVDAQFELTAATSEKIGGVIIGDGIDVTENGTISAANVKVDGVAKSLDFVTVTDTSVITVSNPESAVVLTTVGVNAPAQVITASATGEGVTLAYQWYKKVVGTDIAFSAIPGATAATLPAESIPVNAEGTTIYYCCVTASGEGIVADPVASKQITVIVNPAA